MAVDSFSTDSADFLPAGMGLADFRAGIRLLARLARVADQACLSTGISLSQYRLLTSIADGPQRASVLAAVVDVSRPTLTSLVDGLEDAKLIRRIPVPADRRGTQLELTGAGKHAILIAERALTERMVQLIGADVSGIVGFLKGVVSDLGEALDRERRIATGS